jgi:putative ABC transport system permease protein
MPVYPGVIDMNTATYALKRGLGDMIVYESAGGETFGVQLVGLLETSILQGTIIIAEESFIARFPDAGGYRFFLLDAADEAAGKRAAEQLTRMLGDRGLEMIPAWQRLNEFNAVQNTYLSIFSTLGGLGLLLGTVGLAVVVGRNVLERRGQLGLMQAVGFTRRSLARMVLDEHWFLHVLGVLLGVAAALVAVLPKILSRASDLPLGLLIGINGAILIGGLAFCAVAARIVLRGSLIEALRSE